MRAARLDMSRSDAIVVCSTSGDSYFEFKLVSAFGVQDGMNRKSMSVGLADHFYLHYRPQRVLQVSQCAVYRENITIQASIRSLLSHFCPHAEESFALFPIAICPLVCQPALKPPHALPSRIIASFIPSSLFLTHFRRLKLANWARYLSIGSKITKTPIASVRFNRLLILANGVRKSFFSRHRLCFRSLLLQ